MPGCASPAQRHSLINMSVSISIAITIAIANANAIAIAIAMSQVRSMPGQRQKEAKVSTLLTRFHGLLLPCFGR